VASAQGWQKPFGHLRDARRVTSGERAGFPAVLQLIDRPGRARSERGRGSGGIAIAGQSLRPAIRRAWQPCGGSGPGSAHYEAQAADQIGAPLEMTNSIPRACPSSGGAVQYQAGGRDSRAVAWSPLGGLAEAASSDDEQRIARQVNRDAPARNASRAILPNQRDFGFPPLKACDAMGAPDEPAIGHISIDRKAAPCRRAARGLRALARRIEASIRDALGLAGVREPPDGPAIRYRNSLFASAIEWFTGGHQKLAAISASSQAPDRAKLACVVIQAGNPEMRERGCGIGLY